VAFLCFGLGKEATVNALNWATGVAYLCGGLLHFFVVCYKPGIAVTYVAPTAGLISKEESSPADATNVV
jgi:hypothetical protein